MRFRVLGPLEVYDPAGEAIVLRAPKQRAMLAMLLLHAGQPVSIDRLKAALWLGSPPQSATGNIRTYASGLRTAMRCGAAGPPELGKPDSAPQLSAEPGGYRLALAPSDLDLTLFQELAAKGHRELSLGDAAEAARLLADALALWRGEPAAGIELDVHTSAVLTGLAERRLAAEEAWADARLALGGDTALILKLRSLAAEQPLRERTCSQLMLALYQAGRKAEALAEFRALRRRLIDELGVEPSAPLQELHHQILADTAAPAPGTVALVLRAAATPPDGAARALAAAGQPVPPRQLPHAIGDFTGREAQLGLLRGLVGHEGAPHVAAVTGMAGAGKTALAVHFAHQAADQFPDGVLFIDLRGHAEAEPLPPHDALGRFLAALGVPSQRIPADADECAKFYRSLLAGKKILVLLDNAASAAQVRPLLPASPGCLAVVTSRSRLPGLIARDSAVPLPVGPLAQPESVQLLRKILGGSRADAEAEAVSGIAARSAGLPLALRIAAERAGQRPHLSLSVLAAELAAERRLDAIKVGPDPGDGIRSVFSWSYRALTPGAAGMFRLLGLHPGTDTSVAAATALANCGESEAALLLEELATAHLLSEVSAGRYQAHDLLRAYASELAAAMSATDREAASRRILSWYLHTADAADRALLPGRRHVPLSVPPQGCHPLRFAAYGEALAWCDAERANLLAAIRAASQADPGTSWKLLAATDSYFGLRKRLAAWLTAADSALAAARRCRSPLGEAWVLNCVGPAHLGTGRLHDALDCLRPCLDICRQIGDRHAERCALNNLGVAYLDIGRPEDAREVLEQALDIAASMGDRHGEGIALQNLGEVHGMLRQHKEALAYLTRALRMARANDDWPGIGFALTHLASTYRATGQLTAARQHYEQGLSIFCDAGDRVEETRTRCELADLLRRNGDIADARHHWDKALAVFDELGDPKAAEIRQLLGANAPDR